MSQGVGVVKRQPFLRRKTLDRFGQGSVLAIRAAAGVGRLKEPRVALWAGMACRGTVPGARIAARGVVRLLVIALEDGFDDRGVIGKANVVFGSDRQLAGAAAELELDPHQFVEKGSGAAWITFAR